MRLPAAVIDGASDPANTFVALRLVDVAVGAATGPSTLVLRSGLHLELTALPSRTWLLVIDQTHAGVH